MALSELVDLANERVGGAVLAANDEFFAGRENLIVAAEPVFDPNAYVPTGKLMDGWETRRRREPGHDWAVLELGTFGRIEEVVVDTAHFKGNYPDRCSIQATRRAHGTPAAIRSRNHSSLVRLVRRSVRIGLSSSRFAVRSWLRPKRGSLGRSDKPRTSHNFLNCPSFPAMMMSSPSDVGSGSYGNRLG